MCIFLYLQSRLNVPHWKTAAVKEFDGWLFISSWLFPITRFSHTCRHPFCVTSPAANQRACCNTNCESTWNLPVWFLSVHASSSGVPKSVSLMFCRLSFAFSFKSCADHPIKQRSSVRAAAERQQDVIRAPKCCSNQQIWRKDVIIKRLEQKGSSYQRNSVLQRLFVQNNWALFPEAAETNPQLMRRWCQRAGTSRTKTSRTPPSTLPVCTLHRLNNSHG